MQFIDKAKGWISSDQPVIATILTATADSAKNWGSHFLAFECSDLATHFFFSDSLNGWVIEYTCINGTHAEIRHTSNGGASWDSQYAYTPPFYYRPRKVYFVDKYHGWIVGEHGIILHTVNGGLTDVEQDDKAIPNRIMLHQNYPNPFNPSTVITYQLSDPEHVTIKIYNMLGSEIAVVVDEMMPAGFYSFTWNGANVPSGVYYYKLVAGSFTETRKMMLVK